MTVEEMQKRKRELGYTNQMLSELSGVPLGTVQKVLAGLVRAPRKQTIDRLSAALIRPQEAENQASSSRGISYDTGASSRLMVRDAAPAEKLPVGKRQGEYTIEDYFALPDDVRMELIDGVFYDMGQPIGPHQVMIGEIHGILRECIRKHQMPCIAMPSPTGVQLDRDDRTVVQPDVLVLCDREKLKREVVFGAPDLVVEVLSPSTARKDKTLKLQKYSTAGVREYWIVDLKRKAVICYDLEQEDVPVRLYTFSDQVPVQISGGKCVIDFSEIDAYISGWFPEE
ncbi:MAG: Uma2 family endonuclease [Stomatobaculum sp.]|nr:Uma2 family endonuclease [Stomatobaculum sp.]